MPLPDQYFSRVHGIPIATATPVSVWPISQPVSDAWTLRMHVPDLALGEVVSPAAGPARWWWKDEASGTHLDIVGTPTGAVAGTASAGRFTLDFARRTLSVAHTADVPQGCIDILSRWIVPEIARRQWDAFALHACAVLTPRGAVVIAGDSGAGKSTLACAMVAAGATLLGDEPVCLTGAQMWPGASALRAGPEEVERLLGVRPPCDDAGKAVVRAHVDPVSAQVSCILVLGPRRRRGPLLQRSRLAAPQALVPLIQHRYSRRQAQLAADMRRCAEVAQAVPVYAVSLLEDFDHVQVAAAAILDEQA